MSNDSTTNSNDVTEVVEDEYLENGTGFYPFSQIPVWVTLNASPNAVAVYAFLKTYAREDAPVAFPSRQTIASGALKTKQARSVDRYIAELEHIGAIVKKQRRSSGNLKIRNVYRLQWAPPEDFDGPVTRKQWEDMGSPLSETVSIYKNDGDKKPAYSVVRYSAHRDEQVKHPDTDTIETDKTENTRSSRSAPQRTSMCATAHPGSAPQRTGSRSKPPISKDNPTPPSPPDDNDDATAPSLSMEGGEDSPESKPQPDAVTAVELVKSAVSIHEMGLISRHRRRGELAEAVAGLLSSGCSRSSIVEVLQRDRTGLGDVVAGLIGRLRSLEAESDLNNTGDAFAPQRANDGASRPVPRFCGRCSGGNASNPKRYRRVIMGDKDNLGDMCACHPEHPANLIKENA